MTHQVVFSPESQTQLLELYRYIARVASPEVAARYTDAIVDYCEGLAQFPLRGTKRDDVRPGLRVTHYRKRSVIAFSVDSSRVSILGIFYGGQDYESLLQEEEPEDLAITKSPCPAAFFAAPDQRQVLPRTMSS